jgi:hypothetical protein
MAELVDAADLKSAAILGVPVRVRLGAPNLDFGGRHELLPEAEVATKIVII